MQRDRKKQKLRPSNMAFIPLSDEEFLNLLESRFDFTESIDITSDESLDIFDSFNTYGLNGLSGFLIFYIKFLSADIL